MLNLPWVLGMFVAYSYVKKMMNPRYFPLTWIFTFSCIWNQCMSSIIPCHHVSQLLETYNCRIFHCNACDDMPWILSCMWQHGINLIVCMKQYGTNLIMHVITCHECGPCACDNMSWTWSSCMWCQVKNMLTTVN
jgi:hypothetical protein